MQKSSTKKGVQTTAAADRRFLTLTLRSASTGETSVFGLDLLQVREIRGYKPPTPLPNTNPHVLGVINLRGAVIPVIDLRMRFGTDQVEFGKFTVIIVVQVGSKTVGLVADSVSDVLSVRESDLMPPPNLGQAGTHDLVNGIASVDGRLILLLDLDSLLAPDGLLEGVVNGTPAPVGEAA